MPFLHFRTTEITLSLCSEEVVHVIGDGVVLKTSAYEVFAAASGSRGCGRVSRTPVCPFSLRSRTLKQNTPPKKRPFARGSFSCVRRVGQLVHRFLPLYSIELVVLWVCSYAWGISRLKILSAILSGGAFCSKGSYPAPGSFIAPISPQRCFLVVKSAKDHISPLCCLRCIVC